jgi:hypothetical protein
MELFMWIVSIVVVFIVYSFCYNYLMLCERCSTTKKVVFCWFLVWLSINFYCWMSLKLLFKV